jgi:signal-transduction protein with cAMP-binding, CBS, and nucleotidyltransferase domain
MARSGAAGLVLRVLVLMMGVAMVGFSGISFAEEAASTLSRALGQAKLFEKLTETERAALESAASLRHGRKGERIIQQGQSSGSMFVILGSRAEVRVNGKVAVTLPVQALVGEIEFLDGLAATADVILLEESDLIVLNNKALAELMERQPRLGYLLMSEIARIEAKRLRKSTVK